MKHLDTVNEYKRTFEPWGDELNSAFDSFISNAREEISLIRALMMNRITIADLDYFVILLLLQRD